MRNAQTTLGASRVLVADTCAQGYTHLCFNIAYVCDLLMNDGRRMSVTVLLDAAQVKLAVDSGLVDLMPDTHSVKFVSLSSTVRRFLGFRIAHAIKMARVGLAALGCRELHLIGHDSVLTPFALRLLRVLRPRLKITVVSHEIVERASARATIVLLWRWVAPRMRMSHLVPIAPSARTAGLFETLKLQWFHHPSYDFIYRSVAVKKDENLSCLLIINRESLTRGFVCRSLSEIRLRHSNEKLTVYWLKKHSQHAPIPISDDWIEASVGESMTSYITLFKRMHYVVIDFDEKYEYRASGILEDARAANCLIFHPDQPAFIGAKVV